VDGQPVCARTRRGTVGSGASSKGEDALFVEAALTDPVGDGDFCERPLAHGASDLVRGEIERGRQAFLAVVAVMVEEKSPNRGVMRHDVWNLRAEMLAHVSDSENYVTDTKLCLPVGQQMPQGSVH
jgi:hypothetical protein